MNCSDTWLPQGGFEPRRYRPGGVGNWSGHLPFANDLVASARPELLVELGTHFGESYFGFCQAVAESNLACRCYAVDTWLGETHAGFYDESVFQDVSEYNEVNYNSFSYLLRTTFDEARNNFSSDTIDILHIDGLHTYSAVLHDFEKWLPAVKPGGIVLMHDTAARHADFGVWKVWDELEQKGERFSFLHNWGLGVFRKPGGATDNSFLSTLFTGTEARRNHVRQFYTLCARNLEYDHLRPSSQNTSKTTALLQVYPECEEGYSPRLVFESVFKTKEWEHVRVDVTSGSARGRLRIDITEYPGVIDVAGISLRKAVNNEEIFRASGANELAHLRVGGTVTRLDANGSLEFCRYISSGSDPQLYVELEPTLTDQPLVLDLWMRVDSEVTILLPSLTGQNRNSTSKVEDHESAQRLSEAEKRVSELEGNVHDHQETKERLSEAEKQVRELEDNVHAHKAALLQLQSDKHELEKQKGQWQRELDSLRLEHQALTLGYRRSQGELYVMKRDLSQAADDNKKLETQLELSIEEIKLSKDTVRAILAERALIQADQSELSKTHHATENARASLDNTLRGVLASRSWRVTKPFRRVMEALKKN